MRTIPNNDHRKFNQPSVWVPLFEVTIGETTLYLTPNHTAVTVDGHTYTPFPIRLNEIREDGDGEVSTVELTCSNIEGTLSTAIDAADYVDGYPVVYKEYSFEEEDVIYEETLEITECGDITAQSVTFKLGVINPFTIKLMQQYFLKDYCWNTYKEAGCWIKKSDGTYVAPSTFATGDSDTCSNDLSNCKLHTNQLRFRSFPGIPGAPFVGAGGTV